MVGLAQAQEKSSSSQVLKEPHTSIYLEKALNVDLPKLDINFEIPTFESTSLRAYQSDFRVITPNQFMLNVCPLGDLSNMSELFMGSYTTQSFNLGNRQLRSTYLFDMNGVLRSSQMSFSFGKNN